MLPTNAFALLSSRKSRIVLGAVNPFRTWNFSDGLPSFFKHQGTWRVSGGVLVNEPTLGSEMIANGGFDSADGWTTSGGWSVGGGVATCDGSAGSLRRSDCVVGVWAQHTREISRTSGTYYLNSAVTPSFVYSYATCTVRTITASFGYDSTNYDGTLDNVSLKQLSISNITNLVQLSTSNASISATVAALTEGMQAGLLVNYVDEDNFCYVVFDGSGKIKAVQRVAGTYAADSLSSVLAFSANDVLQAISSGGTVTVKKNGTTIGSPFALNAALTGGTQFGLFSTYVGNTISSCTIARA